MDTREEQYPPSIRVTHEELTPQFEAASASAAVEPPESGDFHDAFPVHDGSGDVGLIIGDVAGHGAAAGAKADQLRREATIRLQRGESPRQTLEALNKLSENADDRFATIFAATVKADSGTITYASAGHEPPVIADKTGKIVQELPSTGPPVGVLPNETEPFEERQTSFDAEATLLAYTDGITEARRVDKSGTAAWFGTNRLKNAIRKHSSLPLPQMMRQIIGRVLSFARKRLRDDVAILALRCSKGPARNSRPAA